MTGVVPRDGERGIAVDTAVTIAFSEPIDETTLNGSTVSLTDTEQGRTIGGRIELDGFSVVFTPAEPLRFGSEYSVVITDGIGDHSGNRLAHASTSSFWTRDMVTVSPAPALELQGLSGGSFIYGYVVVDVNSDGLKDLVYGGPRWVNDAGGWVNEPAEFTVLLNAVGGTFTEGNDIAFPLGTPKLVHPRDAKSADFNGDERDDIFFIGAGYDNDPWPGEENILLLSQPNGSFLDASSQLDNPVSGFSHSCAVGDIDNDEDADLVVVDIWGGSSPPAIYVLTNDGTGQFTSRTLHVSAASSMRWTASELVDLDNDGFLDLVLGEDGSSSKSMILWNTGQGKFDSAPLVLPPADPYFIVVDILPIDLNKDGYQDLVLSATKEYPVYEGQHLQALINLRNRDFADETPGHFPAQDTQAKWAYRIESADLDMDGDLDLVTLYDLAGPGEAQPIWLDDGNGVFSQLRLLSGGAPGTMIPIDVDSDGDTDFLKLSVEYFGNSQQVQRWAIVINNIR